MEHDILSSSDDEELLEQIIRRPRKYKNRVNYLECLDDVDFKMRFRLNKDTVLMVLSLINDDLQFSSNKNHATPPLIQLLLTLRMYSTGSFLITMGDFSGVSTSNAHYIIHRVSKAIAKLRPLYMKLPVTNESIQQQQLKFHHIAGFPRVIGCIDCAHIKIQSIGGDNAELFRNRKGYFSLNVQAVSNENLQITDIVARWPGSVHDSTIFSNSRLKVNFESGMYKNGVLLGDSGYANKPYLLTPLLNPQTPAERLYNESYIKTRNVVERMFGIWKRRFPILALGMRYKLENIMPIIVATAVLNNIARQQLDLEPDDDPDLNLNWQYLIETGNVEIENNDNNFNNSVRIQLINEYFQR
ncbi:putative nuclease HARBI1 [Prorops nasuta]|uniref:putative nuclease HARBI1 n=1 Tax=Prorops nasuta TaxID=863751 RepID=UPI0034CE9B1E